jgi:hypothetical protein
MPEAGDSHQHKINVWQIFNDHAYKRSRDLTGLGRAPRTASFTTPV